MIQEKNTKSERENQIADGRWFYSSSFADDQIRDPSSLICAWNIFRTMHDVPGNECLG